MRRDAGRHRRANRFKLGAAHEMDDSTTANRRIVSVTRGTEIQVNFAGLLCSHERVACRVKRNVARHDHLARFNIQCFISLLERRQAKEYASFASALVGTGTFDTKPNFAPKRVYMLIVRVHTRALVRYAIAKPTMWKVVQNKHRVAGTIAPELHRYTRTGERL